MGPACFINSLAILQSPILITALTRTSECADVNVAVWNEAPRACFYARPLRV
jgi:hypothetical protein